ncbi:hypothetical protein Taro_014069 [Colocasia esculenta]|uniref:Exocyst subunit Exo70 family protein n=1 Tax=Colocasia esculenta TaxID=4460 RepID=A0A843UDW2_COLES|nr:hypothetical protein [Colocasia esculenta]
MDPRPPPGADHSAGGGGMERLLAVRRSLRSSLEKSRAVGAALDRAGPRLDEIHQRLPSLEAAVRPIRARGEALAAVGGHIDRAVGPAAAVLKVFDAVHGLEPSLLSDPGRDLHSYLAVLKRLEEALRFLADNCVLAIQWLDDIVEYVEENAVADGRYVSALRASLRSLREAGNPLDSGLLDAALGKLEAEFRRLLGDNSAPLPMAPQAPPAPLVTAGADQNSPQVISPSPLPVPVVQKLLAILERLSANGRLEHCIKIYIEVRAANARRSLEALGLDYLEITAVEFNNVQSIEGHITKWGEHMEFAVKHLFEAEYKLCLDVFERFGTQELWTSSFSKIAAQAGIPAFLQFGRSVTESKKDPIKLLKLLDIFGTLNRLRPDFNRLFGSQPCVEIQNDTRDLIKRVVVGACEIFWELLVQVELQRQMAPPSDGGVPKLEKYREGLLTEAVLDIIKALEQNFETWQKVYDDVTLSYLFMMNTHWHFHRQLRGTRLGEILGDSWLREHEQYKEYYAAVYLRETWGKLPGLLSREGLIVFSGGRATARDLVKKRLKAFNVAFDETYRKQSNWVIPERGLREKICQLVVQAIVPVYRSYMQNYGPLVEQDASASKSVSLKARHSNGKINNVPTMSQYQSAPTVA